MKAPDGVTLKELEEAAWTDGASAPQSLVRIVLPLMGPGVAVVTVFSFVMMWGNCCCSRRTRCRRR